MKSIRKVNNNSQWLFSERVSMLRKDSRCWYMAILSYWELKRLIRKCSKSPSIKVRVVLFLGLKMPYYRILRLILRSISCDSTFWVLEISWSRQKMLLSESIPMVTLSSYDLNRYINFVTTICLSSSITLFSTWSTTYKTLTIIKMQRLTILSITVSWSFSLLVSRSVITDSPPVAWKRDTHFWLFINS